MDSWFGKPDEPFFTRRRPGRASVRTDFGSGSRSAVADRSCHLQVRLTHNSLLFNPLLGRRAPVDASDNPCHSCSRYCRLPTDCRRRRRSRCCRSCCSVSLISLRNQQKSPLPRLRPTRRTHWLTGKGRRRGGRGWENKGRGGLRHRWGWMDGRASRVALYGHGEGEIQKP